MGDSMTGAIMTCPQRQHLWPGLLEAWPGWSLCVDGGWGVPENFCRSLELAREVAAGEWALMIQDDIVPRQGLPAELAEWLSDVPADAAMAAGFSLGWTRDPRDVARGVKWRRRKRGELLWIMILAVRTGAVAEVVAGVRSQGGLVSADDRLRRWLDTTTVQSYTHLPSVVQHVGERSVMSHGWTIGGRPRQSPTFRQ